LNHLFYIYISGKSAPVGFAPTPVTVGVQVFDPNSGIRSAVFNFNIKVRNAPDLNHPSISFTPPSTYDVDKGFKVTYSSDITNNKLKIAGLTVRRILYKLCILHVV
jgi:hypothetical protein